jgi:hypothetical protein
VQAQTNQQFYKNKFSTKTRGEFLSKMKKVKSHPEVLDPPDVTDNVTIHVCTMCHFSCPQYKLGDTTILTLSPILSVQKGM